MESEKQFFDRTQLLLPSSVKASTSPVVFLSPVTTMKTKNRFQVRPAFWLCAASIGVFALGITGGAHAQGGTPKTKTEKVRKRGMPKKLREALETKLGKPLTDDQVNQIMEATKAREDAIKAARDKYDADMAKITGLTVDDLHALAPQGRAKKEEAPAAATAPAAQ